MIAKGVRAQKGSLVARALRKAGGVRKKLNRARITDAIRLYVPKAASRDQLLSYAAVVSDTAKMDVDGEAQTGASSSGGAAMEVDGEEAPPNGDLLPEVRLFFNLLVTMFLIDNGKNQEACSISSDSLQLVKEDNKRTMDLISARVYFYYSLANTRVGAAASIRNSLLALYRSTCLRHDVPGQAVLQNAILSNYLAYNLYGQAEMFARVTTAIERDNNQYARYLYYMGRVNAVQLHYSDAEEMLSQALRKCPKSALGFRQVVTKLLCVVQLLMGDIPERSLFFEQGLRRSLYPYFKLTQAVRIGSLGAFSDVLRDFAAVFDKDGVASLITRLRHNVIKTGLRKICLSYSKISLASVCAMLKYDSLEDIEYIVAKAIHDGVISAVIDRKEGCIMSKESMDNYTSDEPRLAFDKRIKFCLKLHNESVRAMQYPPDAHKPKREKDEAAQGDGEEGGEKQGEKSDKGGNKDEAKQKKSAEETKKK